MNLAFQPRSAPRRSPFLALGLWLAALVPGNAPAGAETALADLPPMTASPQALLAAARGEVPEDAAVEVLLESARIRLESDGTSVRQSHKIYRVIDSEGAELHDEVSTVYAPWHQEVPTVRARVVLPSGAVHELDPGTLTEGAIESDLPNTYQDLRRLVAPLPAVAPGTVVETVIETVDKAPFFEAGTLHRVPLLSFGGPIRHARVVIDAPAGMELGIEARPEALAEPRVEGANGRVRRTFEMRDLPQPELWLPGQPPEEVLYPFVAVSTAADWSGLATYYSRVVDRQIAALGAPESGSLLGADTPDAGAESQWEQIAARVAWVHERVRYTGVQLGEAAIVPRPPGETLARRYGDCKDKATLVVALLREIGVPAYVALLRAGSPDDVLPGLPGIGAGGFDHAIVYVPGSPALWIDATDPTAALGELPTMSQGRLALVASPGTRELIRTPMAEADDNRTAETREIFLAEYGPGRVVVRTVYRGSHARDARTLWEGSTEEEVADNLSMVAAGVYGSSELSGLEISPLDEPGPLDFRYEVTEVPWAVTDMTEGIVVLSEGVLLADLPFLGFEPADEDEEDEEDERDEREVDFFVREPYETEVLYRIHVPDGFGLRQLPEGNTRSFGPATLTTAYEEADGEVRARLTFRLAERRMSPDQLRALRAEIEEYQKEDALRLWFDNLGWKHLTAGRIGDAVGEYRRLAEAHPSHAIHRLHLAAAVQEVGLRDEARRLAERAVELEPENPLAHAILAQTLLHDGMGRYLAEGWDREAAVRELRRAIELDPEDTDSAVNLAVALEHSPDGARYQDPEGLREAIEVYREIVDAMAGTEYANNLPIALLHADRADEALELLEGSADEPARYALLVTAEAMANGADAAITRAERRMTGGRSERSQILTGAAQNLFQYRRYPEAAALLEAALQASTGNPALSSVVDLYRRMRRHEEVEPGTGTPDGLVRDMVVRTVFDELTFRELRDRMASEWYRSISDERIEEETEDMVNVARQAITRGGLSRDLFLDVLYSGVDWTSEEDPLLGHVVTMEATIGLPNSMTMLVVESEAGLLIVGADQDPASYGRYAFELARDGELERAAAYLDRALEHSEAPEEDETLLDATEMLHSVWPAEDRTDAEAVTLAAAVLASEDYADDALVEVLRQARPTEAQTDARDQALASALLDLERPAEALEVAQRIETATGEGFYTRVSRALLGEEAPEPEIDPSLGDDERARAELVARANALVRAGELDEALAAFTELLADPDDEDNVRYWNDAAWLALATGDVGDRTLEWAETAVEEVAAAEYASLHTLAAVQAARGSALEAFETLTRAVSLTPGRTPGDQEWYVLGLVAEGLRMTDAARRYYERVEAPEDEELYLSTRVMAKERLRALDGDGGL